MEVLFGVAILVFGAAIIGAGNYLRLRFGWFKTEDGKELTPEQRSEVSRMLEEYGKNQLTEGTSEIGTEELAKAAGPDTTARLQEALQLQAQHKEREAIDALYEAFRRDLEPTAKAQLHILTGTSFLNLSQLEEAEGHYRQALTVSLDAGDAKGQADA